QILLRGRCDVTAQLVAGHSQIAAVEVDGSTPDFFDKSLRQSPRQMLAPGRIELAGEALAQLIGESSGRIKQAQDAPDLVPLLGNGYRTAPAVKPHELRQRDAVAKRKGGDHELAQAGARALDDRSEERRVGKECRS